MLQEYQKAAIDLILTEIALGSSAVVAVDTVAQISHRTFCTIIRENESVRLSYTEACRFRGHWLAESILDINSLLRKSESNERTNALRAEADNCKWVISRMLPKLYGDKQEERDVQVVVVRDFSGKQPYDPSTDPDLKKGG